MRRRQRRTMRSRREGQPSIIMEQGREIPSRRGANKAPVPSNGKIGRTQAKLGTQARATGPGGGQSGGVVHNGSALGQDRAPAQGRALPLEGGVRLPGLLRYWRARSDLNALSNGPDLESQKGSRRGHNLFESDPLPGHPADSSGQASGSDCGTKISCRLRRSTNGWS